MQSPLAVSFHFSNGFPTPPDQVPLFLRSSGVAGHVVVKGDLSTFDTVKLVLKGHICNVVDYGKSRGFGIPHSQVLDQNFLKLVDVREAHTGTQPAHDSRQYPFDFRFMKGCHQKGISEHSYRDAAECQPTLPSSLSLGKALNDAGVYGLGCSSRVRYEVQVLLFRGDRARHVAAREILVYDSACHAPPPANLEDFSGEFKTHQQNRLARAAALTRRRSAGKMSIRVSEPPAVEVGRDLETARTSLPMVFEITDVPHPPAAPLSFRLKSTLQASTFISNVTLSRMPSSKQSRDTPNMHEWKTQAKTYTQVISVPAAWKPGTTSGSWTQTLQAELPLLFPQAPVPSFESPYLVRRYRVAVRVDFCGLSCAKFEFCVPLQILYTKEDDVMADEDGRGGVDAAGLLGVIMAVDHHRRGRLHEEQLPIYVR